MGVRYANYLHKGPNLKSKFLSVCPNQGVWFVNRNPPNKQKPHPCGLQLVAGR